MEYVCFILDLAHSSNGESVILDFPSNKTPAIGMTLTDQGNNLWKIIGIGMPVILDLLRNKISTHYDSERVWDCLIQPVNHKKQLTKGEFLSVIAER